MDKKNSSHSKKAATVKNEYSSSIFKMIYALIMFAIVGSAVFISQYNPDPQTPQPQITFDQKIAHLETGAPLPGQETRPEAPRWLVIMILAFIILQITPLLMAAYKTRHKSEFTLRDLRQIEFLTETPLYLGLLGSLLGVCMTHFLAGTLSAPLAYLTTISGILLYLFGRFTILVSLPLKNDLT